MDKAQKLQRYSRKDYSECVEFPVEIVARNGSIRRYPFEESVQLYFRRIILAPMRYRDPDLIRAEISHCRNRIAQLRRSFFYHHGWGTPQGQPGAETWLGDLSGELAAFLCRIFWVQGRLDLQLIPKQINDPNQSVWSLQFGESSSLLTLYVFRFADHPSDVARNRFFAKRAQLASASSPAANRLLRASRNCDCGFLLAGPQQEFDQLIANADVVLPTHQSTPWQQLQSIIRSQHHPAALLQCQQLLADQPWHRQGYLAGAVLASHLGQHLLAEELAVLGSLYFPDDADLHLLAAAAQLRQHRLPQALASLQAAVNTRPDDPDAQFLQVVALLRNRQVGAARRRLRSWQSDPSQHSARMNHLKQHIVWRNSLTVAGALGLGLAIASSWFVGFWAIVPVFAVALVVVAMSQWLARGFQTLAAYDPVGDLDSWMHRINQKSPEKANKPT